MTHLPLTLGDYTTACEGPATITHIGKHGKWAFNAWGNAWLVKTGVHRHEPALNITGRVEPAPTVLDDPSPTRIWAWGNGKYLVYCAAVEPSNRSTVEYVRADTVAPVQLEHWRQECGKLHSQIDRVTALNDHADELLDRADVMLTKSRSDLARVTAERDEAVALIRMIPGYASFVAVRAFLAKIGGKP